MISLLYSDRIVISEQNRGLYRFRGVLYVLLCFIGKSKIYINKRYLHVRQGLYPFRKSMQLKEIEAIHVGEDCIYFVGDKKIVGIRCGGRFSELNQM